MEEAICSIAARPCPPDDSQGQTGFSHWYQGSFSVPWKPCADALWQHLAIPKAHWHKASQFWTRIDRRVLKARGCSIQCLLECPPIVHGITCAFVLHNMWGVVLCKLSDFLSPQLPFLHVQVQLIVCPGQDTTTLPRVARLH